MLVLLAVGHSEPTFCLPSLPVLGSVQNDIILYDWIPSLRGLPRLSQAVACITTLFPSLVG